MIIKEILLYTVFISIAILFLCGAIFAVFNTIRYIKDELDN